MSINFTTAAEAVKLIQNGHHVYIQGKHLHTGSRFLEALAGRGNEYFSGVTLYSGFAVAKGPSPYCRPEFKDSFLVDSFFVSNAVRQWIADGYGTMTPRFLGEVPALFRDGTCPVDVTLLNCSRPNADGYVSYGVSADLAFSAAECSRIIIAQINSHMPFSYGDPVIHLSQLSAAVEADDPLVEVPTAVPTEKKYASATSLRNAFRTGLPYR